MSFRPPLLLLPLACGLLLFAPLSGQEFTSRFEHPGRRVWIGPDYQANRLQDWALDGQGRVVCREGRPRWPLRTLHLLSASHAPDPRGPLVVEVLIQGAFAPRQRAREGQPEALAGLLLGAGGPGIDPRLTSWVHHRPAEDGGLLVAVTASGAPAFYDLGSPARGGSSWSIKGPLRTDELKPIAAGARGGSFSGTVPDEVLLRVRLNGRRLRAEVVDPRSREELAFARLEVEERHATGRCALVSHLSPRGDGRGFAFRDWKLSGPSLRLEPEQRFGPVLAALHTLSRGTLTLTAQMPPLGPGDSRDALLRVRDEKGRWRVRARSTWDEDACQHRFRVEEWDASRAHAYRVETVVRTGAGEAVPCTYEGRIRAEPKDGALRIAAFTGTKHYTGGLRWNPRGLWFPHADLSAAVAARDPDLLFWSGDQLYEGDLTPPVRRPFAAARLDYLERWFRWCRAFGELARDRVCICIPDDHDVYHGNIWGAGGRAARRQDDGGYTMPPRFVRLVERTQTAHLPPPADPRPIAQGSQTYFCRLRYAGVDFAVLEDRKFKSAPGPLLPEAEVRNGWAQAAGFDAVKEGDPEGAVLLGDRQLAFLDRWARDWSGGIWMKVALSQTVFANVATLPASARSDGVVPRLEPPAPGTYPPDDVPVADMDSNGWPRSGRDRAVRRLAAARALHIAGDQHLASVVRYGLERHDEASIAFCVPSVANTWPRRWFPRRGGDRREEDTPPYTGRFRDGFGNRITVHAVANPMQRGREPAALHDRSPGFGIVDLRRAGRDLRLSCWPRSAAPDAPDSEQYPGWPLSFTAADCGRGNASDPRLGPYLVEGVAEPVVEVYARDGELLLCARVPGPSVHPRVPGTGPFKVVLSDGEGGPRRVLERQQRDGGARRVRLPPR